LPKMKMSNLIPEQMQKLATRYRKEWDIDKILAMSKETAIVLQYVPSTRILELFEKAFEKHKYFPNDRELEAVWRSMEASEKKVKGYYDLWGAWIRWGTFYTWMTCPGAEWKYIATNREKELREKYKEGKLTDAEALEWEPLSKKSSGFCLVLCKNPGINGTGKMRKFLRNISTETLKLSDVTTTN